MNTYTHSEILEAYKKLGVRKGGLVFFETDLACLGMFEDVSDSETVPAAHFNAVMGLLGNEGTIIVPTFTNSLRNTDIPYDPKNTPSQSILSEYIRCMEGAVRSMHPFTSYTGYGKHAFDICGNTSRHSYGPETPMARLIERNGLFINIGFHPHYNTTVVHQLEMDAGVPYRYVREYVHPVMTDTEVREELYYCYVWYYECDIRKNYNRKLWKIFSDRHEVQEVRLGRGKMYSYSMYDFYKCGIDAFKKDLYLILETIPMKKPYRKSM